MKIISTLVFVLLTIVLKAQTEVAVEQMAEFPGGLRKFYDYVGQNLKYPKEAKKQGIQGTVLIQFIVTESGAIERDSVRAISKEEYRGPRLNSDIVKSEALENEAIRVIRNSPKWIPGSIRGKPTRQKITFPFVFKI